VPGVAGLSFMQVASFAWRDTSLIISRSGYTGEDGFEILVDASQADALWSALLGTDGDPDPRVKPIGLGARDSLRLEAGLPLYGHDLDDTTIPQEAGLNERAVSFTKGCYVGQETVARLYYRGKPNRHLRGLRLSEPVPVGATLKLGERVVGQISSAAVSPTHGPIALALVRREAAVGETVAVAGGVARVKSAALATKPRPDRRSGPAHVARAARTGRVIPLMVWSVARWGIRGTRSNRTRVAGVASTRPSPRSDSRPAAVAIRTRPSGCTGRSRSGRLR